MSTPDESNPPPVEIVIAEDSPTQAHRLRFILEKHGYKVTHAANGRLALEAIRLRRPTLVISDVVMPEMDGYELCRRIKADAALSEVPVILVTALSDPGDVIRGLECRADNFILKPYEEHYLVGRVKFVLLNREIRRTDQAGMGVEIFFGGQRHFITADRLEILNLLLSTYDAAIQRNKELIRAQEELRQLNERMKAANQELEAFSYSVSHDLRAPLRHIGGFAGMLERNMAGRLEAREQGYLGHITKSAAHMSRLIDDLLEFSRMGRAELRFSPVDLNAMVREIITSLEPETKDRKINWQLDPLPPVKADPAMMRQVYANLIANAVKYSRNRAVAEIAIGSQVAPTEITLFVRDNGAGFDMKYAEKLFGVFQRLHSAEEFEGTGIGLANVRRIIARHGGRTWAEGEAGKGATFYFTLPLE